MIDTSTELFNAFLEDTRQIMVKVTIGDRVFDNDNIATLNLEYGSMDGANFGLGSTFASSLKITFAELVEGLAELDEIEVEMGAVLPDETIEYVKMGTFIINEEVMMDRNNNTTSIDAMDRMVMLGEIYEPTLEGDYARIIDIAVDIANQVGVVVSSDFDRLRTDSIRIPQGHTLRDAIGLIAQFEVGFATFNRDGELAIRKLNDPNFNITPEDYTMKGLVKNEVPFWLNGAQCQVGDSEEDALQTGASTGTQIILNNPSMTQAHLDRIYTELSTLNYYPFSLDWYGHPALEAGDWIEIEDLQGNKFKTPNLHYTLDFNGGLKAKSQAETTSSSEVVYQYKSPLKQEIQTIAARLSASGGNHVYDDLTPPTKPKEGDLWFKPEGPDTIILIYERLEDGSLDWVEKLNTGDTTKNADAIEEQKKDIDEAKKIADEAVDEINTAIQNAGFTSLDDTLQNMNYITMNAEQSAQQAITDASNAYGLAQTSISEAQTAQANSLTALGKADNALDGVSSLNVRVDDVEDELELKADNAFLTEDNELITLSNAITINAHRFNSDMQRIESRVEGLAGEINLAILSDAFEGTRLVGNESYPNPSTGSGYNTSDTMREMIAVEEGEQLAISKNTVDIGYNWLVYNYYDDNYNYIGRSGTSANEYILTVPSGVSKIWVSYPKGSQPQIVRGTEFIPYRPNLADQMTSDEVTIFRNEYDEFADKTERRMTNIDGSGGRLEVAENLITQTANGLQTTVGKVDSQGVRLSTVEQTASGLQTTVANKANQSQVTQLAGGLNALVQNKPKSIALNGDFSNGRSYWTFGTGIDFGAIEENRVRVWLHSSSQSTSGNANRMFNNERFLSGRKYRVTFDAMTTHGATTTKEISVGQSDSTRNQKVTVTETLNSYEIIYHADRNGPISFYLHDWGQYEIGNIEVVETNQISQAQISVLNNNINLRVTKGELLSQINIEADRTLIQSNRLLLNANNTVITGTAWMDGAVIANASIDGAKIQDATIGSAKIANLDVSKISGNTTEFVQSTWNSINSEFSINGNMLQVTGTNGDFTRLMAGEVRSYNDNSSASTIMGSGRSQYYGDGSSLFIVGRTLHGNNWLNSGSIQAQYRSDFAIGRYDNYAQSGGNFHPYITLDYRDGYDEALNGFIRLRQNTTLDGNLYMTGGTITEAYEINFDYGGYIHALSGNSQLRIRSSSDIQIGTSAGWAMRLANTHIYVHRTLSMEGHNITNQSDERLKFNIEETNVNSLDSIKSMTFVEFDRTNGNHDEIGVIAQDTPSLALYDSERDMWSINSSKQIMMNSHAIQQLYFEFDERVESNESKIHKLQQELSKANRRIEELEGAI